EEEDGARRLAGRAGAAHRDHRRRALQAFARYADGNLRVAAMDGFALLFGLRQARVNAPEGDGVHLYVELAPFLRERFCKADYTGLARRVVGLAGVAARARSRADVDDLAGARLAVRRLFQLGRLAQVAGGGADDAERGRQVDG